MVRHLYFHIPFCPKLCPYCSFYVETGASAAKNKTQRFLDAILCEVEKQSARFFIQPQTIYFGGGTPSMLSISQLAHLLDGLLSRLTTGSAVEWTFEINPATVTADKAKLLRDFGVNRISIGAQSFDDAVLRTLGRTHNSAQTERTFYILREAGFENVNVDLMFAVPGQTRVQWQHSLEKTIALKPEHVSAYCLTFEEDTEFFRKLGTGEFSRNENRDADFFETTIDALGAAGFAHYEISNYAKPGRESLHNFAYWSGADYLGFGPSAFSTVGLRRWQNVCDSEKYAAQIFGGESPISFEENLDAKTKRGEIVAFGLRTNRGVSADALAPWSTEMRDLWELGFLKKTADDRVALTRRGKLMADSVAETFV